jgi:hypothetical protein
MYNHFNRTIKCHRNVESLKYTDDQIAKYSLISLVEHNKIFKNKDNLKYNTTKTTAEFIKELKTSYKEKRRSCNYCNSVFNKYKDLEYHLLECIYIPDKDSENKLIIDNSETNNIDNSITNNTNNTDNSITNSINNNININVTIPEKKLVSFDDKWDTGHIDRNTKTLLFMSTLKYTKTLEYILRNDLNNNVLLDKDSNTGIIYKCVETNESFEKMKIEDIVDTSMIKLYNHLKDFYEELVEKNGEEYAIDEDMIEVSLKVAENKFNDYNNNKKTKEIVSQIVSTIYNKFKDCTKDTYKSLSINKDSLTF